MPNNKKIIFGLVGELSSGKGTATAYLEKKYQASTYRFSTILRDLVDRIYIPQSRDDLIKMSECIRATFGDDILAKTLAGDAQKDAKKLIVVEGIRRPMDIIYLSKLPNFVLIKIFADPRVRYDRLIKRGENTDDNSKTYEQFLEDHQRSTELTILEVAKNATEQIDNNGSFDSLYQQLDDLIKKYC